MEIPENNKLNNRFRKIELYNLKIIATAEEQFLKIKEEFEELEEAFFSKSRAEINEESFDLIQATYVLLDLLNNSDELKKANKKHLEKLIYRHEKRVT